MPAYDEHDDEPLRRLERYLAEDTIRVEQARGKLVDIGDALMALRARMHNIDLGDDPGVQVLTQEMAAPMIDRVAGQVDRTGNVILSTAAGAGQLETNSRHERDRAVQGQYQRAILHPSVLETELSRAEMATRRGAGQLQRVCDLVETEFLLLGDEAVVTLAGWGDAESPYVFIRNPAIVRCFAAWFDLMWSSSLEVEASPGSDDDALIRMLSLGAKDEMIARSLHVGLRTVRRRVAGLMDQYGVGTRFQLGVALERDGRLEAPPR